MPRVSKIDKLKEPQREKVKEIIRDHNYSDYDAQTEDLKSEGIEGISRSALARYGTKLKSLQGVTAFAVELQRSCPDDSNALAEASTRLIQEDFFKFVLKLQDGESPGLEEYQRLAKIVRDLTVSSMQQKKYRQEVKDKVEAKFKEIDGSAKRQSLDPETLRVVREEIYGLL